MAVSTDNHDVILENDAVRMLDTRLAPGQRTAVHAHERPAALYDLRWSDFIRRDADGAVVLDSRTITPRPDPGTALWGAPLVAHSVENVGDRELHIIAVEIKGA
jgi:hypothetical protein